MEGESALRGGGDEDRERQRAFLPCGIGGAQVLREAVGALGPDLGFLPKDVSARCLRAAGAMALLLSDVDTNIIQLIGRWRSDAMLRYLHVQAEPLMRDYSRRMLNCGTYNLIPNQVVACALVPQLA